MASNWPSCTNPCKNTRNDSWSCCSLIGHKKTKVLWHQSEARTTATVWNWSGKTVSPGAPRFVLYFSSPKYFFARYDFPLAPTNCPWVSEDAPYMAPGKNCNSVTLFTVRPIIQIINNKRIHNHLRPRFSSIVFAHV